ncbi:MAG TPA: response regulator [Candidatus Saccharibacteria bacterium]|jgi:two-component system phosphate regulon response regulator PhoB|nr:response regulator [Candidatus Saccharibacteria bacterium]
MAKKILLVEDEIALASVYTARLSAEGYEVESVNDGQSAVTRAIQNQPDLILLDIMIPKLSGIQVLKTLRENPETKNIKVIMLTALSQDNYRSQAESMGISGYLVKSQVVIFDVVNIVRGVLGS